MTLSEFIQTEKNEILQAWEGFARTLVPVSEVLEVSELRDEAEDTLEAIARDLSGCAGKRFEPTPASASVFHSHGMVRFSRGLTPLVLIQEFRALRTSVLRLYADVHEVGSMEELAWFNEAIDHALTESSLGFDQESRRLQRGPPPLPDDEELIPVLTRVVALGGGRRDRQ